MSTHPTGRTYRKTAGTPDYDDPIFWDKKFATGQDVGEWLNPGDVLIEAVISDLQSRPLREAKRPKVLHLGPGISKLGAKVRDSFVAQGWAGNGIVNADFSAEAVRLGLEAEKEKDPSEAMHWVQVDLRSWDDVAKLLSFAPFDIILDKSTSDAIATSAPAIFASPDIASNICPIVREIIETSGDITLSPVELLGLHLASLTEEGTIWVSLSYSTIRFDNLSHLAAHWTVVSRTPLKAPQGQASSFAYTPEVFHWVYILRRK
ncbi:hypothetical protein HFD88_010586 [Aspergillus terreus]|nr:hypothetical protein HFD88_010586 [Aspergillus terreus]